MGSETADAVEEPVRYIVAGPHASLVQCSSGTVYSAGRCGAASHHGGFVVRRPKAETGTAKPAAPLPRIISFATDSGIGLVFVAISVDKMIHRKKMTRDIWEH